jgi:amidase
MMERRSFLASIAAAGAAAPLGNALSRVAARSARSVPPADLDLTDATVAELGRALGSGQVTSVDLVRFTLSRIAQLDRAGPALRAIIETNPEAESIAAALDAERKAKGPRGPLHGIPVVLKDNIDTADRMTTTAGSLALEGSVAPRDSSVAARLRAAGAVLVAKANLSEWANFRSTHSSSGWSGRGGQGRNPYALDRSPCGSSSGSAGAVAAGYCTLAVGSETDGSIICPSAAHSLVGLKPTVGLVSRAGIIPISASQDTAGPMARTVADAAALLTALAGPDPRDPASTVQDRPAATDYTRFLDPSGLKGVRIGVARKTYMGYHPQTDALVEDAIRQLRALGATIVDPADIATANKWGDAEFEVLLYEFKAGINAYLASLGPNAPMKRLGELIAFNDQHRDTEMPFFGQEIFEMAEKKGPLTEPAYRKALASCRELSRAKGIDATLHEHRLDAIVAPSGGPTWLIDHVNGDHELGSSYGPAAVAGYAGITVPAGYVDGIPIGLSFFAGRWSEPTLLRLAYAYEQATRRRRPPNYLPASGT